MTYKFIWLPEKRPDIREKEKQKGVQYRVRINYKIFPEVIKLIIMNKKMYQSSI